MSPFAFERMPMLGAVRGIRVLLVDDNEEFLAGASAWVSMQRGLVLVGTARSGAQALLVADELHPDLVLMDAGMPGIDGYEATRRLKARERAPRVVIVTFHDTQVARHAASAAGADGFVVKDHVAAQLRDVIRALFDSSDGDPDATLSRP